MSKLINVITDIIAIPIAIIIIVYMRANRQAAKFRNYMNR